MPTAQHRPALKRRRYRHDDLVAVDLFSGFGGLTEGIRRAGFLTIMAANHNAYKVEVHEANHPYAEHWIADLVNPESSDYHSARDLPAADLLVAGVSCVNHSQANTKRAYAQGLSLFDLDDPEWDAAVTRSERDRATANCVLHYAAQHRPRMILVECTTELVSWGIAAPGKRKIGDGSTYRWWLNEFTKLGYRYRELYLNSMFFGVPQSRDRLYVVFWDKAIPAPNLDHTPQAWCDRCDRIVESVWAWKTRIPPSGVVRHGKQYHYLCPSCRKPVMPAYAPSLHALDLTDLGTRIGDRTRPLAAATMARAERCRQRFAEFPAVVMPAKAAHGAERHLLQPLPTQTSQQEAALLTTGAIMQAAGNTYEHPGSTCRTRGFDEPLWTQPASPTTGILTPGLALSSGVVPFRQHTIPVTHAEAMPTVTADQIPGLVTAAGRIQNNGSIDEAAYRAYPLDRPLGTVTGSAIQQGLLFSGWFKQNGSTGTETVAHPVLDPLGTLTSIDTTAVLSAEWADLAQIPLEDCYSRMLGAHEVGRGCGFDVNFGDHQGSFVVWGSARAQVDGYGNAVSPPVGHWIGLRLREALHGKAADERPGDRSGHWATRKRKTTAIRAAAAYAKLQHARDAHLTAADCVTPAPTAAPTSTATPSTPPAPAEPTPTVTTVTADQLPGLVTAAGRIQKALSTVTGSAVQQGLLFFERIAVLERDLGERFGEPAL